MGKLVVVKPTPLLATKTRTKALEITFHLVQGLVVEKMKASYLDPWHIYSVKLKLVIKLLQKEASLTMVEAVEMILQQEQLPLVMDVNILFALHILRFTTKLSTISFALISVSFLYGGIQSKVSTHQI
jgi:hypothetical protein